MARRWWRRLAALFLVAALASGLGALLSDAAADDAPVTALLGERDGSGVNAEATLTAEDGLTQVTVRLASGDDTYLPYLRRGSCGAFRAEPAVPLALVSPGTPSRTTVDIPLDELRGRFVIALYRLGGDIAALQDPAGSVACGPVGEPEPGGAALQPPVSGVGLPRPGSGMLSPLALLCGGLAGLCAWFGLRRPVEPAGSLVRFEASRTVAERLQRYV